METLEVLFGCIKFPRLFGSFVLLPHKQHHFSSFHRVIIADFYELETYFA